LQFDCARCDELLLDFAYGELDEVTSAAFRRHADGCARCSAALGDIRLVRDTFGMLPMENPAESLDAKILAAAEARRRELAGERPAARESASPWARFLEAFRRAAMRPQLAMAMVLLLVVGIVLVLAPEMRSGHDEAAPLLAPDVPSSVPAATAAPSAPPVAATPSADAVAEPAPPQPEAAVVAPAAQDRAEGRAASTRTSPASTRTSPARLATRSLSLDGALAQGEGGGTAHRESAHASPRPAPSFAAPPSAPESADSAGAPDDMERRRDLEQQNAQRFAQPPALARAAGARRHEADAPSGASSLAPSPAPIQLPSSSFGLGGDANATSFDRGMTRYRAGQFRQAIPDLEAAVARPGLTGDSLAAAHLAIARSYRQVGNCAEATRRYEDLMRRFSGYAQNADVNWETAECYRLLGNTARADQLYGVAERSGRYAERARARRVQMDGARRAARAPADEYQPAPSRPAAESAPAAASQ
jgi:tetratricopeptide (TPR) repeat protein